MLLATLLILGLLLVLASTTIATASIQLKANAEALEPGFQKANKLAEKAKKDLDKRLGTIGDIGEKLRGGIGQAQGFGDIFDRMASGSDKFAASVDLAEGAVGNLVNSMRMAKAMGQGVWSGIAGGLAGLAAGVGMSLLMSGRREDATPGERFLTSVGARGRGRLGGVESFVLSPFGGETGAGRRATRIAGAFAEIGEAGGRARDAVREIGVEMTRLGRGAPDAERWAELMDLRRRRDAGFARLTPAERDAAAVAAWVRSGAELRRLEEDLTALAAKREAIRRRELALAERRAAADRRARDLEADFATGAAARDSLLTDRERALAELRSLVNLRARTPGAISEETIRGRADALARGLEPERPIGVQALEAGTSEAVRGIRAAMRESERRPEGERLLEEVRDEARRTVEVLRGLGGRIVDGIAERFAPLLRVFGL